MAAGKLDENLSHLRLTDPDLIGRKLLRQSIKAYSRYSQSDVSKASKVDMILYQALETSGS